MVGTENITFPKCVYFRGRGRCSWYKVGGQLNINHFQNSALQYCYHMSENFVLYKVTSILNHAGTKSKEIFKGVHYPHMSTLPNGICSQYSLVYVFNTSNPIFMLHLTIKDWKDSIAIKVLKKHCLSVCPKHCFVWKSSGPDGECVIPLAKPICKKFTLYYTMAVFSTGRSLLLFNSLMKRGSLYLYLPIVQLSYLKELCFVRKHGMGTTQTSYQNSSFGADT